MADTPASQSPVTQKSKGLPMIAKIAIGCFGVAVLFGILATLAGGWFMKKAGTSLLEKTIESQSGIQANIEDLEQGKMSFTSENGTKVDIGSGEIPESFPKDFPVYPGAKVTSSLSGSAAESTGNWITLSTGDGYDKVKSYYVSNLKSNGWTTEGTFESGPNTTLTVSKGTLQGTVTIDRAEDAEETTILIILGTEAETTTEEQ